MSRNGSGTYSLPAGNPVVTGSTIASSWANTTLADIATELTNSLPRDGQAGPTGPYNWNAQNLTNVNALGAVSGTFSGTLGVTGATTLSGSLSVTGTSTLLAALNEAKGADLASAATVGIGAATGNYVNITGTTTITAFDTVSAGTRRIVRFTGALTLTYDATKLILPGSANITTVANDIAAFVSEGSGNWRCTGYLKADGTALVAPSGTTIQGAFKNLKIVASGLTNTSAVLTADEVVLENASNAYYTARSVNVTINSTASGANGLDTGTVAASTWYSVWVIYNGTTVAGLLSLSATAPTMPSGYTYKARLGWVRTDSSGNKYLLQTAQNGRKAQYVMLSSSNTTAYPTIASGVQGTYNTSTCTLVSAATGSYVPSTASQISLMVSTAIAAGAVAVAPGSGPYTGWSGANYPPIATTSGASQGNMHGQFMLESSNIYYAGAASTSLAQVVGWEDNI